MTAVPAHESHFDTLTRVMLAAWAGEPLPDIDSPEYENFERALTAIAGARPIDMQALGCAAAKALLEYHQHGLLAQRAAALAQLSAKGGLH